MDASIYALVLVPALTDLLPNSGIAVNQGSVGYYGSILQAMFLLGWGLSMVWGPISDRVGRVRALMLTILCYSLFTFLCGVVNNIWQLAILRILVGIGIGGEQPVGAAYLAEELSESQRKIGAGLMHTGYYFGFFFASVANYFIGANYGWRWMFIFGGLPALLIGFIRFGVRESTKWQERFGADVRKRPKMRDAFATIFSPVYLRRTMVMSGLFLASIIGLWAGSIYVPTAVTQVAVRTGSAPADAARLASYGGMLLAIGTIVGCIAAPFLAERLGRRRAMAVFFTIMGVSIVVSFGYVFYLTTAALTWFYVCVFFLGFGGANFALYTLWLPEQYTTDCRASAIALRELGRPVRWRGDGLHPGQWDSLVRQPGRTGGGHSARVRLRVAAIATGRGDAGKVASGVIGLQSPVLGSVGPWICDDRGQSDYIEFTSASTSRPSCVRASP